MHPKKLLSIYTHVHTHRLGLQTTHASIISTLTEGGTRRKARLRRDEGVSDRLLPPGGCGITDEWTGLLEGYSGFNRPHEILRFVLRVEANAGLWSRPDSAIINEIQSVRRKLLISLHGDLNPTRSSSRRRQWAWQSISSAAQNVYWCVVVCLFVCWPGLIVWPLTWSSL